MPGCYKELLELCAFDEHEIVSQKQRIGKAFKKLGIDAADMEKAVARVKANFDIELTGMRKVLGVWLKELFDVVLAGEEGKKIIYYGFPPFQYTGLAIKAATRSKGGFWIGCPEVILCMTLGQIFGKLAPVLEAGEAAGLPPGHAMCSLLQIKNGALGKGWIPLPDLSIATSYFCDMGPKADELMQYRYGYPVEYVDSCLDSAWGEWPQFDRERVSYLGGQLNNLFATLKNMFGLEITEEIWNGARTLARKLYKASNDLNRHLATDPTPLGVADSSVIASFPVGCTGVALEEGADAVGLLAGEVGNRVKKGLGVVSKGSPKVFLMYTSMSDPAFNRLFQEVGLAVPLNMALLPPPRVPDPHPYPTLGEKRAERALYGGVYHSTYGGIKRYCEGLKLAQIDGIIYSFPFSCRPLSSNSMLGRLYMEKETNLPVLLLDMDMYDDRNYSAAALRTRLEAFSEMLWAKKAAA